MSFRIRELLATTDLAAARRRVLYTAAFFVLVMVGSAALAESGVLAADSIRAVVFAVATNLLALALALTRPGAALAAAVAPAYWVIFQGFRVPLEFVLHAWGEAGTIPVQMTWSGQKSLGVQSPPALQVRSMLGPQMICRLQLSTAWRGFYRTAGWSGIYIAGCFWWI